MSQGSMQDIKRRIGSVGSTKQITKAMELVSTSKLKKARARMDMIQPYYSAILSSIQGILADSNGGIVHPLLQNREVRNKAYIVITSDRGLAGGYNSNVIKKAVESIDSKDNTEMIVVGKRGISYFERRNYDIVKQYTGVSESPSYADATRIANIVLDLYRDEEVDEVNIVYTHFVSTITHEPKILKVLPAEEIETPVALSNEPKGVREYEPSPAVVLDYLVPKYVTSAIYGTLIESSASEQGARRMAMENATDNAEEMIEDLDLQYNRARQAAITQEISEIVGGADAIS